ncbi:MAG: hypothetical protein Q7T38_06650 [Gallionella sp.]|nr:hypothetical protein [Gallionella sp.]
MTQQTQLGSLWHLLRTYSRKKCTFKQQNRNFEPNFDRIYDADKYGRAGNIFGAPGRQMDYFGCRKLRRELCLN